MKKTEKNKKERMTFETAPDILNADEACELLTICRKTLFDLTKSGQIKHFRLGERVRYTKGQLKEFIYGLTGDANFMPLDEVENFDDIDLGLVGEVASNYNDIQLGN